MKPDTRTAMTNLIQEVRKAIPLDHQVGDLCGDDKAHYHTYAIVRNRPFFTNLLKNYYPAFEAQCAVEGRMLPDYVRQEFEDYLKCGRLEHGFLRVRCNFCTISNVRSGLV
jgi:hypothetical protein